MMKAIQITIDEGLLRRLDADAEARRDGRSAVIRRAVAAYLGRRRRDVIREGYARAYGSGEALGEGFRGWENEGEWPET